MAAHELNVFQNPDVNMRAKNYAAADYIIPQAKTFVDHDDVIQMQEFVNYDDPETPAEIGVIMPKEIGERLTQLGYNIDMALVNAQIPAIRSKQSPVAKPDFIFSGNYTTKRPTMDVSLRITEVRTGRVVGTFDYTMATNREIRKLAKPKAQIMIKKK